MSAAQLSDRRLRAASEIVLLVGRAIYQHGHVEASPDTLAEIALAITQVPSIAAGLAALDIAESRGEVWLVRNAEDNRYASAPWEVSSRSQHGPMVEIAADTAEDGIAMLARVVGVAS